MLCVWTLLACHIQGTRISEWVKWYVCERKTLRADLAQFQYGQSQITNLFGDKNAMRFWLSWLSCVGIFEWRLSCVYVFDCDIKPVVCVCVQRSRSGLRSRWTVRWRRVVSGSYTATLEPHLNRRSHGTVTCSQSAQRWAGDDVMLPLCL